MISIKIEKSGSYTYEYELNKQEKIQIEINENINATCLLLLKGKSIEVKKNIILKPNSNLNIIYENECETYKSDEAIKIYKNSVLNVGYFELDKNTSEVNAVYRLLESEAKVNVITTTLARSNKEFNISCEHNCPYTHSNMENYAINDIHGSYNIVASGNIIKGAYGSKSHQLTRVLTLANREKVKVTPLLLIDENDVEASHACSIGEMNIDHLYYLQTRGLNKKQALGLLTLSYILPILKIVENEIEFHKRLEEIIERKVGLTC